MLHSYRDVFQTLSTYRKGNGSPLVTPDVNCSSEFLGRPGSQHRPKFKSQLVSQTTNARSNDDKEASLLPLVWVEVRDNVIPPHAVPFASDGHGPLFIARAHLEGIFFLGKAGPQLTSGAVISYGCLDITVTRYDVLVCAGRLSWEIPHSSGTGFMHQDTVVTKYDINYDLEPAPMYHQDISENTYNLADIYHRVDNNQRSATPDPDPDPAIVASHTRAPSNSRYGLSSNESLDVDKWKAYDNFVPLRSPLELTERSRSLPPRARTSAESSFNARAELGNFRCDNAQSAGVTTVITSATHRPEYAPVSRPGVVASSKPQVRLDCVSQESHRLPTVVSADEYSTSERGTPVGSFGRSEITRFREVANVDGWSEYSSPPPEPPVQLVHTGSVQDVVPLRRYPNTGITTSTSVNRHANQLLSTSATNHSLASNVIDPRFTNFSNPSPKDDSQYTPMHYSFPSHKMSSDSSPPRPSTVFSRGTWAGTPGNPVLCLCTHDDIKDTSTPQSKLANCPVHPAAETVGISASSGDVRHVDQYDRRAYPVAQAHVWQHGAQPQKYQSKDSPSRVPQPPTFPSTDSPPAQSSLVGDHPGVDVRSTQYSRHGMPKSPTDTSSEDGNTAASEHMCDSDSEHVCDSEHWQLVSRTTFDIEAQTYDGAESDVVASELPAPITINPLNAGIVTGEVKLLPYPVQHITSASQKAGDSRLEHSRVAVQESVLEREPVQENQAAVTAVSQTTSTGESTSVVPCRGTLVAEECVPLLTVACTPSLPPSRWQSTQTISCSDSSVTDDKLHRHHEHADSSVLVCASAAPEENNNPTPTRSRVIAVENTQKPSPSSNDPRIPPLIQSTSTIAENPPLTVDRHEEPYGQDVARDKPSQGFSAPKLEGGEEDVSADRKRQTVEGREDHHEKRAESEVKPNLTSYSRTVRIVEGYTSESAILNDDRRTNEGADGAALSMPSIDPGFKVSPSEPDVPQDSGTNHIESGYEHRSLDVDTVSKSSIQIASHDSTESSEEHIQRQDREEVDSVLVRASLAPAENIGTPAPDPRRAVENTQKSNLASNDLRNSSLPEDTWMMGQTSSPVADLKGGSRGHIVGTDLPTQCSSTANVSVEHDEVPVSADCMHHDSEGRGDYHAREVESEVTLKSKSYSSAVESLRQPESATVLNAGGRSDQDTDNDISSLPSTYTGRQLSLSEPSVPQDAGINHIQSAREHQSSDINVASTTLVQTSSHQSTENRVQSSLLTTQGGSCSQDVATVQPCQTFSAPTLDGNELAECAHQAVESRGGRHELETESEFKLSSTAHSHSVRIVERSTSETVVSKVDRKMDEDTDVPTLPSFPMTALPPSDPSIPQDAGTDSIQSGCEHQSSGVDTDSIPLVQTSSHDCSTEREGYRPAQSFSGSDEPEAGQTPLACDYLQGAPSHDVTRGRYSSRSSSIPKFEDNKVDASAGCAHQASVTRGDYHEREMKSEVEQNLACHFCSVEMLGQSTSDTVTGNNDRRMDKDADDTALPLSSSTIRPKLSISEPDIPQDAATSSKVTMVLTTSMQTSSHSSTASSEHLHRQPAQTSSCSNELPIDYKVNQSQTTAPVHLSLAPGENNPTPTQPCGVASENTQQPSPASDNIRNPSLPEGVSATGQPSSPATHECGEPCSRDGARDLPSQGSSTPKLKDDKEEISADRTCQVMEDTRNYKSDPTDGREKESRVGAKVAMLISPSPNPGPKGPHSEPSVPQDAAISHVQSEREHHITEDITVSVMSVHASSNCLTSSSNGCAYLDNSSQQSNNSPGTMSVPPMHDGPRPPSPAFYDVHDSLNCSCVSRVIASPVSIEGDSTAVVTSDVVKKSVSSDDDHPVPCAEGTPGVNPRQDEYTKAEPTVISIPCDSNTVHTSSQTENQDNPSSAADTRRCGARESGCSTVSLLSDDCGASKATTAPHDSPSADEQLTQTAATDCVHESRSTTDFVPVKSC